jgi:hypothetical protein
MLKINSELLQEVVNLQKEGKAGRANQQASDGTDSNKASDDGSGKPQAPSKQYIEYASIMGMFFFFFSTERIRI